jgi:hypothetical protein
LGRVDIMTRRLRPSGCARPTEAGAARGAALGIGETALGQTMSLCPSGA